MSQGAQHLYDYESARERLVSVVQELSLARDLPTVMSIVRLAARDLTGADGATFVLRDGDMCYYAEENAISPLWKGRRFPMSMCISGWVMLNREPAIIEDIYSDHRIPAEAYRPTFVKSLVMVPIRTASPIGAIGNYWATSQKPAPQIIRILQALADTTSVTLENVQLYNDLEQRVRDRTVELEAANRELEAFSFTVSHDLRAPLRSIDGFSRNLAQKYENLLDEAGQDYLRRIRRSVDRTRQILDALLTLSQTTQAPLDRKPVDLASLASDIVMELRESNSNRSVRFQSPEKLPALCDPGLVRVALENLLSNAWKFTEKCVSPVVEFGLSESNGEKAFYVKDNGAGFDSERADKLFQPFQRFHSSSEFPGTGIGLATVQRIVAKHGGTIWAQASPGAGAAFYFTLGVHSGPFSSKDMLIESSH